MIVDRLSQTSGLDLHQDRKPSGVVRRAAWAVDLIFAVAFLVPALQAAQQKPLPALEGKLMDVSGKGPVLKMAGKEQILTATTPYLFHTLQDKRLADREVRVEGRPQPDGTFQVEWLYTIRDGKLYRVRYYCKTCNIVALEPGNCVCCQQPTELQEIPVTDSDQ